MKQITIYEFLKKNEGVIKDGWVAFDGLEWLWFSEKPEVDGKAFLWLRGGFVRDLGAFNIRPFKGDWKDSLIRIDHFHQNGKMVEEEE